MRSSGITGTFKGQVLTQRALKTRITVALPDFASGPLSENIFSCVFHRWLAASRREPNMELQHCVSTQSVQRGGERFDLVTESHIEGNAEAKGPNRR